MTPYDGKKMGQGGDYGPPQSTTYYTPDNPVYPYPLDRDFNNDIHLPGAPCCTYNPDYPWTYVPGNYFATDDDYPDMGKVRSAPRFNIFPSGDPPDFHMREGKYPSSRGYNKKEGYSGRSRSGKFPNRRLPTTPGPRLNNGNFYPPFNNFY